MESFIFEIGKSILQTYLDYGIKCLTINEKKNKIKEYYSPTFKKMYVKCEFFIESVRTIHEKFLYIENNQTTLDLTPEITRIIKLYCEMWRLYIKEHREFYEDKFTRVFEEISTYYKIFYNLIQFKDISLNGQDYYSINKGCEIYKAIVNTGRYVDILKRMVW